MPLDPSTPYHTGVTNNDNGAFKVPFHNAKVIKEAVNSNTAPFLPDNNGQFHPKAIHNGATGFVLNAQQLIPMLCEIDKSYTPIAVNHKAVTDSKTVINASEKGIYYNYKDKDGQIRTTRYFFPEQTQDPEKVKAFAQSKIDKNYKPSKDLVITAKSPDLQEYMANFYAACKTGANFTASPEVCNQFRNNLNAFIDKVFDKTVPSNEKQNINSLLFEADKRSKDIIKSYLAPVKEQTKQKSQDQEYIF